VATSDNCYKVWYSKKHVDAVFAHIQKPSPNHDITDVQIKLHLTECVTRLIRDSHLVDDGCPLDGCTLYSRLVISLSMQASGSCRTAQLILQGQGGFFATACSPSDSGGQTAKLVNFFRDTRAKLDGNGDSPLLPLFAPGDSRTGSVHQLHQHVTRRSVMNFTSRAPFPVEIHF
jgi:hypothetical protein